uniref:Uncharacterized protein n=1 Tax=Timema poppense TaxID=170557 RepID=A0A7R9H1U7_TIMPO|nr:unnamed protein product [Timema poppensis]
MGLQRVLNEVYCAAWSFRSCPPLLRRYAGGVGGLILRGVGVRMFLGTWIGKLFPHNKAWGRNLRQVAGLVKVVQWDIVVPITFLNAVLSTDYLHCADHLSQCCALDRLFAVSFGDLTFEEKQQVIMKVKEKISHLKDARNDFEETYRKLEDDDNVEAPKKRRREDD